MVLLLPYKWPSRGSDDHENGRGDKNSILNNSIFITQINYIFFYATYDSSVPDIELLGGGLKLIFNHIQL